MDSSKPNADIWIRALFAKFYTFCFKYNFFLFWMEYWHGDARRLGITWTNIDKILDAT